MRSVRGGLAFLFLIGTAMYSAGTGQAAARSGQRMLRTFPLRAFLIAGFFLMLMPTAPVGAVDTGYLSPKSGPPGAGVRVHLNYYNPNADDAFRVLWDDGRILGGGTPTINGVSAILDVNVTIPANATSGTHTLRLSYRGTGYFGNGNNVVPFDGPYVFTVTGSPVTNPQPSPAPPTGCQINCSVPPTTQQPPPVSVPINPDSPFDPGPNANQGCFLGATASCGLRPTQPSPPSNPPAAGPTGTYPSAPSAVNVFLNPPGQVCVSWNGINGANQYKVYDGSGNFIESAAVANTPKCLPSGVGTCFIVSAVTNNGETAKSMPVCVNGSSQPTTQTNAPNNPPQSSPSSADPTGRWRAPSDNSSTNIGDSLHFEATADASRGVKGVNFTGIRPGNGSNWETLCQGQPLHENVYGCDWPISGVSQGDLIIGFDVYDGAGGKAPSPDHNRIVHLTLQFGCVTGGTQGAGCSGQSAASTEPLLVLVPGIIFPSPIISLLTDQIGLDGCASAQDRADGTFAEIIAPLKAPGNGYDTRVIFNYHQDGDSCLDSGRYSIQDTAKSLKDSVAQLDSQINDALAKHPTKQINIVTHSLGGLITLAWASTRIFDPSVHVKIVLLDSPLFGCSGGTGALICRAGYLDNLPVVQDFYAARYTDTLLNQQTPLIYVGRNHGDRFVTDTMTLPDDDPLNKLTDGNGIPRTKRIDACTDPQGLCHGTILHSCDVVTWAWKIFGVTSFVGGQCIALPVISSPTSPTGAIPDPGQAPVDTPSGTLTQPARNDPGR